MAFSLPDPGSYIQNSFSPSEKLDAAKYFVPEGAAAPTLWEKAGSLDIDVVEAYTSDLDLGSLVGLDYSQFLGGLAGSQVAWTFITAPEDVSWDIANNAQRVDIFGTNNPPVIAGSRGMRDLTLGNSLVEGFVRNVTVEAKVAALEKLMEYSLNASDGFVSVPVYQVWANKKPYGGAAGYFIIKDVRVKETMRDLTGNTTRAYVDVSLMQVPEYQVNSGRDQASTVTAGGDLRPQITGPNGQGNNAGGGKGGVAGTPANGGSTSPAAKPAAGPAVGTSKPTTATPGPGILPTQDPAIRRPPPR